MAANVRIARKLFLFSNIVFSLTIFKLTSFICYYQSVFQGDMMQVPFRIKLADPGISSNEERAAIETLRSGQLVKGPKCVAFESLLAERTCRKHAIVASSGTAALVASMYAMGIGAGSKVIVPGLTFPAPAAAAAFLGAQLVVVDVDYDTLNVSASILEEHLAAGDVSLVVAIDQFGMPAPISELAGVADQFNVPILVDAACSIGSVLDGSPCGSFGQAAIFSFHPRKVITTGEGGAVLTDDDRIMRSVRKLVNHGIEKGQFASIGINMRLGEVPASIGLSQLGRLDQIVKHRRILAKRYLRLPLRFQVAPKGGETNFQTMVAILPERFDETDRAGLFRVLGDSGVELGIAGYSLMCVPSIVDRFGGSPGDTPVATEVHRRGFALPLHDGLTVEEVDEVVVLVQNWLTANGVK
jgi:perosamine synthetase